MMKMSSLRTDLLKVLFYLKNYLGEIRCYDGYP